MYVCVGVGAGGKDVCACICKWASSVHKHGVPQGHGAHETGPGSTSRCARARCARTPRMKAAPLTQHLHAHRADRQRQEAPTTAGAGCTRSTRRGCPSPPPAPRTSRCLPAWTACGAHAQGPPTCVEATGWGNGEGCACRLGARLFLSATAANATAQRAPKNISQRMRPMRVTF